MARAERAGAFGEDGEDAAGGEKLLAVLHGFGVDGAIAVVFVADDRDAGEKESSEKIFAELRGDKEDGGGENGFVDPAVDGAIAVESDEKSGAMEAGARGEDLEAREVAASAELGEELVPEVRHGIEFTMGEEENRAGVGGEVSKLVVGVDGRIGIEADVEILRPQKARPQDDK
jgi:hypothetical protein